MKFAIVESNKVEPFKGLRGACPNCGEELISKCGEIKVHHWAHKNKLICDSWWENETEWHRNWKNQFPLKWQEVIHTDKTGERHIADVKTDEEWVLEFQHSKIKIEELISRNEFYSKIVWIVDGLRLANDRVKFFELLNSRRPIMYGNTIPIYEIGTPGKSRILRDWSGLNIPVFLDFHETNSRIWLILPRNSKDIVYTIQYSGTEFIRLNNQSQFNQMVYEIIPQISNYLDRRR